MTQILPPDQIELHMKIQIAKEVVAEAQSVLQGLTEQCKHVSLIQRGESAVCQVCRQNFGWWCPESADHLCHYTDGDIRQCADEYCIFCHQPDERK